MKRRGVMLLAALAATVSAAAAQDAGVSPAGLYTAAQATAGKATYAGRCAACHGETLAGVEMAPALSGPLFMATWSGVPIADLLTRIQSTMPLDAPGSLSRAQTSEIVAYILSANGHAPGATALAADPALVSQTIAPPP